MSEQQPEALRLADALDGSFPEAVASSAADELRRLHEAHEWQYKMAGERLRRIEKLEALNQELLKALKSLLDDQRDASLPVLKLARDTIAKAEGESK